MGILKKWKVSSADKEGFTLIGDTCRIDGAIEVKGRLVVDGIIEGTIKCDSLETGPSSRINANIEADDVTIRGFMEGDVFVHKHLDVASTGNFKGSIAYGTLSIEPGGKLSGSVSKIDSKEPKVVSLDNLKENS